MYASLIRLTHDFSFVALHQISTKYSSIDKLVRGLHAQTPALLLPFKYQVAMLRINCVRDFIHREAPNLADPLSKS